MSGSRLHYFVLILNLLDVCTGMSSRTLRSSVNLFLSLRNPVARHPALAQIGNDLIKEKDYGWALQFYDKAIMKNPVREASYYHGRGTTYMKMNDLHSAISDFKIATSTVEKAGKGERLNFDDTELVNMGTQLIESGRTDDAYWCYTEAIVSRYSTQDVQRQKRNAKPSYYRLRGNLHFQRGNLSGTLSDYRDAVSKAIESGDGETSILEDTELERLGDELVKDNQRLREALWCYDQAIKRNPSEERYYRLRGVCFRRLGDNKMAIADFREGLKLANTLGNRYVLVRTMFDAGMYNEALDTEIRNKLNDAEIVDIALPFFYYGKYEDAIRLYSEALEKNPANLEAYEKLAECNLKFKNFNKAMSNFQQVLDLVQDQKPTENSLKQQEEMTRKFSRRVLTEAKDYHGDKKGLASLLE